MTAHDGSDRTSLRQDASTLRDAVRDLSQDLGEHDRARRRRFRWAVAGAVAALIVVVGLQLLNHFTIRERSRVLCPLLVSSYIEPDDPRISQLGAEERARYLELEPQYRATLERLGCARP